MSEKTWLEIIMSDKTWFGIIPSVPLARGVPVVSSLDAHTDVAGLRGVVLHVREPGEVYPARSVLLVEESGELLEVVESDLVVDLEDPQGFGYALRALADLVRDEDAADPGAMSAYAALSQDLAILRGEVSPPSRIRLAWGLHDALKFSRGDAVGFVVFRDAVGMSDAMHDEEAVELWDVLRRDERDLVAAHPSIPTLLYRLASERIS